MTTNQEINDTIQRAQLAIDRRISELEDMIEGKEAECADEIADEISELVDEISGINEYITTKLEKLLILSLKMARVDPI